MAALTIRNLPDDVHDALRRQAASNRRSMEAEARAVLAASVGRPTGARKAQILADFWAMSPGRRPGEPEGWSGVDEFLAEKHLDGAWENGHVTDEERQTWLGRLGRFEIQPSELEAFVASRVRSE